MLALVHVNAEAQVAFQEIKPPDSNDVLGFYNKIYFVEDSFGYLVGEQTLEDEKAAVSFSRDKANPGRFKESLRPIGSWAALLLMKNMDGLSASAAP